MEKTLFNDFWEFMKENKKWWLLPILFVLLLVSGLIIYMHATSSVSPFVYVLF